MGNKTKATKPALYWGWFFRIFWSLSASLIILVIVDLTGRSLSSHPPTEKLELTVFSSIKQSEQLISICLGLKYFSTSVSGCWWLKTLASSTLSQPSNFDRWIIGIRSADWFVIIIALIIGLEVMGIIGMFLAVPIAAVLRVVIEFYIKKRIEKEEASII